MKMSEETKRKIGKANKGKIRTKEAKEKMSAAQRCRVIPPEVRAKMIKGIRDKFDKCGYNRKLANEVGLTLNELRRAKKLFSKHRLGAKERNIEFLFTFDEWIKMWVDSGH